MSKPKTPVGSFGAEVFTALIEGSRREIRVDLPYRSAVQMRQRMHRLRAQMREESHPLYDLAMRTQVRIEYDLGTALKRNSRGAATPIDTTALVHLIICPRDTTFSDALKKAGIEIRPIEDILPSPEEKEKPKPLPDISIDSIFGNHEDDT